MAAVTMQTQRTCLAGKSLQTSSKSVAARASRPVVMRAEANLNRDAVLGGVLAGVMAVAPMAQAVDIIDGTKLRQAGFDIIYEARDLSLPQGVRDGIEQFRNSADETKKRITESQRRIDTDLGTFVTKKYWTSAREELRGQLGNLRADVRNVANKLEKSSKKNALDLEKKFNSAVDKLDFAIRKKSPDLAGPAYAEAKDALNNLLAALG